MLSRMGKYSKRGILQIDKYYQVGMGCLFRGDEVEDVKNGGSDHSSDTQQDLDTFLTCD